MNTEINRITHAFAEITNAVEEDAKARPRPIYSLTSIPEIPAPVVDYEAIPAWLRQAVRAFVSSTTFIANRAMKATNKIDHRHTLSVLKRIQKEFSSISEAADHVPADHSSHTQEFQHHIKDFEVIYADFLRTEDDDKFDILLNARGLSKLTPEFKALHSVTLFSITWLSQDFARDAMNAIATEILNRYALAEATA